MEAAVPPFPCVAIGDGCATAWAPPEGVAPQTQNQFLFASLATKKWFVEDQAAVSRASVIPRCSENHTGRRSVLTESWTLKCRARSVEFSNVKRTITPGCPSGLN